MWYIKGKVLGLWLLAIVFTLTVGELFISTLLTLTLGFAIVILHSKNGG